MGEFASALAGAFFGALAAYMFQRRFEREKAIDAQHNGIVRAQLDLIAALNTLHGLRNEILDPIRKQSDRALRLQYVNITPAIVQVDLGALTFLLLTNFADFVGQVHVAELSYRSAIATLADRNRAYSEMHQKSEFIGMRPSDGLCTLRGDPRLVKLVEDSTSALFESVDRAIEQCEQVLMDLRRIGKVLYPGRRFLEVEFRKGG